MKKSDSQSQFMTLSQLGSMSQRQDLDDVQDNYSPLLTNISTDKPGIWSKRKGIPIIGTTRTGSIKGLIEWIANTSAVDTNKRIRDWRGTNFNLEILNQSGNTFTSIDTSQVTIAPIDSVNYNDRVYHVSRSNYLSYETGGALTQVTANNIKADCMTVAQNTLCLGNVTTLNSITVDYQTRVYYSDFSSNVPTDNLYDSSKGQTIATTTNYFTVQAPVVGLFNFSATGLLYTFTRDACFVFDMRLLENRIGPKKVFDVGLINKRAICECNGWMIWMDYEGRIWSWSGYGLPDPISWDIQDDENMEAILSNLDRSDLTVFNAGTINNKFYFSLGSSLTFKGTSITNPVVKGLIAQNRQSVAWTIDAFPVRPSIFTRALIGTNKKLIFGSATTDDIYQINSGTSDGSEVAINAYARTKALDFGLPFYYKQFMKLYIKYRPQPTAGTYLVVKYAMDGNFTYTTITDPTYVGAGSAATGTVINGTIDMNIGYSTTTYWYTQAINLPTECRGKNISIEVGNNKANQSFAIKKIGFKFDVEDYDVNVLTS